MRTNDMRHVQVRLHRQPRHGTQLFQRFAVRWFSLRTSSTEGCVMALTTVRLQGGGLHMHHAIANLDLDDAIICLPRALLYLPQATW